MNGKAIFLVEPWAFGKRGTVGKSSQDGGAKHRTAKSMQSPASSQSVLPQSGLSQVTSIEDFESSNGEDDIAENDSMPMVKMKKVDDIDRHNSLDEVLY